MTNPNDTPAGAIEAARVSPAVAAEPRWYGFRWNEKGAPPTYLSFPGSDELTLESGDPSIIIPAPNNGNPLDMVHAAALDGAKLNGIAWLTPGARRSELFHVRGDHLVWIKESTATEQEKLSLLDSLGFYDDETRKLLIDGGVLSRTGADTAATLRATMPIEPDAYRGTDDANADLFLGVHGRDVRYCPPWEKWLL